MHSGACSTTGLGPAGLLHPLGLTRPFSRLCNLLSVSDRSSQAPSLACAAQTP